MVRDYAPNQPHAPPVLVVPSLINRPHILDLEPDHSLLRQLAAAGLRPLLIDWQTPDATTATYNLSAYALQLHQLASRLAQQLGPLHWLGYCLGGTLALAALQLAAPATIRRAALLATPWHFGASTAHATGATRWGKLLAPWLTAESPPLPPALLRLMFASLQPTSVADKFWQAPAPGSAAWARFVATEDWLNDGVPLAAPAAAQLLESFYGANAPANGQWQVAGQTITPQQLPCPLLHVLATHDTLVPPACALRRTRRGDRTLALPTGHIGLLASQHAPRQAWQPLQNWFLA